VCFGELGIEEKETFKYRKFSTWLVQLSRALNTECVVCEVGEKVEGTVWKIR